MPAAITMQARSVKSTVGRMLKLME